MAIEVEGLSKIYGEYKAVENLSFKMENSGVFALLGTNGAGKTTSIRMMLGMLKRDSGTAKWEGKPIEATSDPIGYLAEERGLYPKVNVTEQLVYFATLRGMTSHDAKKNMDYWFSRLEIEEYKNKKAFQLSKGNQQKVQLVAALITDPKLLILDEPMSGLDPVNSNQFREIIKEQSKQGKYIIMSSHQMNTIEEFCDDLVILNKGKTVLKGNLKEIKKSYGRVNLSVKSDSDITELAKECGLLLIDKTPEECKFKVPSENNAENFLKIAANNNISIVKFELSEPSLNEIFIEKVGESQ